MAMFLNIRILLQQNKHFRFRIRTKMWPEEAGVAEGIRDFAVAVAQRIRAFEVREVIGQAGMDRDAGATEEWGRMDVGDVQQGAGAEGCRY